MYDLCPDCLPAVISAIKFIMGNGKDAMTSGVLVDLDLDSLR